MPSKAEGLEPLQELLDSVIGRLEALESKVGIEGKTASAVEGKEGGTETESSESPAVKAYEEYVQKTVIPLVDACNQLGELEKISSYLKDAWEAVGTIVAMASRAKMPSDIPSGLQPYLKPVQTALGEIRKLRLDRAFDWHLKAILEMATCLSWILVKPPPQAPITFCKEAIASSVFWSNRIRKQYKGKDEKHIAFCDALKVVGSDLLAYITDYHKTGLTWNPKGKSLAEAATAATTAATPATTSDSKVKSPVKTKPTSGPSGGGITGLMAELEKKRTSDGSSAATGLKKVARDQQTWRKEFKGEKSSVVSVVAKPVSLPKADKSKVMGKPICEYQDRGSKWIVENQTKQSASDGLTIEVTDPKQQVYLFNCEDITVQIKGDKLKSIIMDKCSRCAVVFGTCISSCEMVNCKKIQAQTTGICPTFSIDKTDGCLIYLSKDTVGVSSFVTSQSSEMNVSYPDGADGDHKEVPIPEQFVHTISGGVLSSEVSDLYH